MSTGEDWWTQVFENNVGISTRIVQSLQALGVKVMAFDFDRTLVDLNTGGKWKKSAGLLANHMRPCMKDLIGAALVNPNIVVSIVTFSIQPKLIYEMLKTVYPTGNTDQIIIAANPNKIKPQLEPEIYSIGKEKHIEDVCKHLEAKTGEKINPNQIILFDDRKRYCKIAEESGHMAFIVNNDVDLHKIQTYVDDHVHKKLTTAPNPLPNSTQQPQEYQQPHQHVTMVRVLPRWPERQDHSPADIIFQKSLANRAMHNNPNETDHSSAQVIFEKSAAAMNMSNNPIPDDHSAAESIYSKSAATRDMVDNPYNAPLPNVQQFYPVGYATSQAIVVNQTQ